MLHKMSKVGMMVILLGVWLPSMAQQSTGNDELEAKIEALEAEIEELRSYNEEIREEELESELDELKSVDKESLTKEEKKAWRKEKRAVKQELYDLREDEFDPFFNRNLYGARFSPFLGHYGWGYSPFLYRRRFFAPRRVIIVRRSNT